MRLNHEYWCEPECTWQTNSINKTAASERLDSWASRLWRGTGIELVFKSLDCFTVRPFFSNMPITRIESFSFLFFFFFFGGGGGCSAPFTIGAVYLSPRPRDLSQGRRGWLDVSNVALVKIFDTQIQPIINYASEVFYDRKTTPPYGVTAYNIPQTRTWRENADF